MNSIKSCAVKVKTNDGVVGFVDVENWANPRIWLMDFQVAENGRDKYGEKVFGGDTMPEEKEKLEYLGVENYC